MFKRLNQQVIRLLFFAYIFFVLYVCVYVHESVQVPVCVRVCAHVCVYCMHSCVFVCVCTYLCYRSHQVSFLIASTLFLETGTLTGVGAIDLARLGWLVCSSDSPVFSLDNHWAYRCLLFCLTFFWVLGGQTQVLILAGQHINAFTISAALTSSLGIIAATAIFRATVYVLKIFTSVGMVSRN